MDVWNSCTRSKNERNTSTKKMKILNTVTATSYSEQYNAHIEKTYSLIRPYVLTYRGAARAIKNEYPDLDTNSLTVTRIQTAIFAR